MHVVATAGHVDHGKSTLVRALTGRDPDRLAEEKRRGLTIELGFAWTELPAGAPGPTGAPPAGSGPTVAFVDVPGHERFIATMLAGVGPAPAVMFVVAADEGWRQQSSEHLAAVDALGLSRGVLVVSRSDLADPAPALADARARIARSSLGEVPAVAVSALDGRGLPELRAALSSLVIGLPPAATTGRVRLWIDRSFSVRGAGTVVTGTLGSGTLTVGDRLQYGLEQGASLRVRGLQSLDRTQESVAAVARVAVNLRDVAADEISRGDVLLSPGRWRATDTVDVRLRGSLSAPSPGAGRPAPPSGGASDLPTELVAHLGTAAVPVRVRLLGPDTARLTLRSALPIEPGDRLVLRDPGRHAIAAGATVLDADPPRLQRRGAAAARAADLDRLATVDPADALAEQVARRRAVRADALSAAGVEIVPSADVRVVGDWLVSRSSWEDWQGRLRSALTARAAADPLDPGLSDEAARTLLGVPDRSILAPLVADAGLRHRDGRIALPPAADATLGATTEAGLRRLTEHLTGAPFAAPERPELDAWQLGPRELAAAERAGRLVRITPEIVLLPRAPAEAMRVLAALPQPFTTSEARQALHTTRRVVIPLLEHLDRRGWTVRRDAGHREVRRGA